MKTSTGQSLYNLTFGIEAVAPAELVWPPTRIIYFNEEENNCTLVQNLKEIEELREKACLKELCIRRRVERYYNLKVAEKVFF